MKLDNQHLDFLISQYVDDALDPANRKLIDQQLAASPEARQLYKDHRDVQDLLDDWGNRIPMINWDEFDKTLATRLADEPSATQRTIVWRRWTRPLAAAAALFIAATVGYGWHAWTGSTSVTPANLIAKQPEVTPLKSVKFVDAPIAKGSGSTVSFPDAPKNLTPNEVAVDVHKGPEETVITATVMPTAEQSSVTAGATTHPNSPDTPH